MLSLQKWGMDEQQEEKIVYQQGKKYCASALLKLQWGSNSFVIIKYSVNGVFVC